jgi:pimeloyl-ACP methyl ester carboxylesterase
VLVGHSLGGMIAQETAARFPERVAGLVLFATSAAFGGKDDTFKNEFLAQRLAPLEAGKAMPEIAEELTKGLFGPNPPESARRRAIASMGAIPPSAYRAALECIVTFNRTDDLARIACPTLVLAAEHDRLAPPKTMERMAARIPGAAYRCIAGAGHLANFEQTAAFATVLDDFLATLA